MQAHYVDELRKIKALAAEWNLSEREIERIIGEALKCAKTSAKQKGKHTSKLWVHWGLSWKIVVLLCVLCVAVTVLWPLSHYILERNIQELFYPGMKLLRKIMLPVISFLPSITEWYDEACLVGNPYFQVSDIDCWPCEGVRNVLNVTGADIKNSLYHSGIPILLKDKGMKVATFQKLSHLYADKVEMFERDASHLVETDPVNINSLKDLFSPERSNDTFRAIWKVNRLEPSRELRLTFGFPFQVPKYTSGVTPEKFVITHQNLYNQPYSLPSSEGATVFLFQGSDVSMILLDPSPECSTICTSVSVILPSDHILWFSWWYWRATIVPFNSANSLIYMGSYY